jgi:N-acetylneuraminic acid mutarotase
MLVNDVSYTKSVDGLLPGKTYYLKAFIVTQNFGVIESDEIAVTTETAAISDFPQSGYRGDEVSISGTNFSTNTSDYTVKFGDHPATVKTAERFSLSVVIPEALPRGPVKITVTIGDKTITSATDFTPSNSPTITSISPTIGYPGTTIEVKGKDFAFSSDAGPVKIGGVVVGASNINNADPDNASFLITVPASMAPGQYDVVVTLYSRSSTAPQKFTIPASPWIQKTNLTGAREGAVAFGIGNKGYVALGADGLPFSDLWEYDLTTDVWTKKADFPGDARYNAVAFSIGDKGYVGCGSKEIFTTLKDFWEYNPATNSWTRIADFAGTGRAGAVGLSIDGKGYIGLGRDAVGLKNDWWEYVPGSNTWTQRADFIGDAREAATAVTVGSKGYVGLGNKNSLSVLADFFEYNPANNVWVAKASFGGGGRAAAIGFAVNNQVVVGSGFNSSINPTKDFWKYDPSSNQWTQLIDLDVARFSGVGFTLSSTGFIISGQGASSAILKDVWKYTP